MINNILYLNNRYITSYSDLRAVFEILKDEKRRPEFLQDEILEAFFCKTLTKWLECEPSLSACRKKTEEFYQEYMAGDMEYKGNNAVLGRLTELILGESIELMYNFNEFLKIKKTSLKRNETIIDDPDIESLHLHSPLWQFFNHPLTLNKSVELDERLVIEFEFEVKRVINDTIIFSIKTIEDSREIHISSFGVNLSNTKIGQVITAKVELGITGLKHFKEGFHKLILEDKNKNELYSFDIFNHNEFNFEIPLWPEDYLETSYSNHYKSIVISPHKEQGIVFNKLYPEKEYEIVYLFKLQKASNAIINFDFHCDSLKDLTDTIPPINLKDKKEGDTIQIKLKINYDKHIVNAEDGCHTIKMLPSTDYMEKPLIYVSGGKKTLKFLDGPEEIMVGFTSYCDAHTDGLFYYSEYIKGHDFGFFRRRDYKNTDIEFAIDHIADFIKNFKSKKNKIGLPSRHLAESIRLLDPKNIVEECTEDYNKSFLSDLSYIYYINNKGLLERLSGWRADRKFAFRLSFGCSYTPQ